MKIFKIKHKTRVYLDKQVPTLTESFTNDFHRLISLCNCKKDSSATDTGTCTLGGGIKIHIFRPRYRTPDTLTFMSNPYQGNTGSYKALKPVLEYLNKEYPQLNAFYDEGNID